MHNIAAVDGLDEVPVQVKRSDTINQLVDDRWSEKPRKRKKRTEIVSVLDTDDDGGDSVKT